MHEQAPPRQARSNPLHALRGFLQAVDLRVVDVSINTVTKLLVDAGETCLEMHDELVRDVKASKVQCDEIWSFCYAKQKNVAEAKDAPAEASDVWTWDGH